MAIENAGFDSNLVVDHGAHLSILGCIDGLLVRARYSYDYGADGDVWTGGACIESLSCPLTGVEISGVDLTDEVVLEALNDADQEHTQRKAGYLSKDANKTWEIK